ncbi:catalase family peroxidase [Alishewanella sp. SMS9]|nr:catalase family peroxidase [Alishewanella sp. SMS9]
MRAYVIGAALVGSVSAAFLLAANLGAGNALSAQDFVDLQQGSTAHAGFRRAHAKGFCVAGDFISSGALAPYSSAAVLQAGRYPFIGRFSIAGNNPLAPDLKAPVRSFAITLLPETAQQWRIAMNTPPVLAVGTPEKFYLQLQAIQNNSVPQFFAEHPESQAFVKWRSTYQASSSFASERYHSINAFYLQNAAGQQQAVKWAAVPMLTSTISSELDETDADALQKEFFARLNAGMVSFDWQFTLGTAADDENNATVLWPDSNVQISAGVLQIHHATEQLDGNCNALNFDPLVLPRGVAPTADPILRARAAAYAESHRRRAREVLVQSVVGEQHE